MNKILKLLLVLSFLLGFHIPIKANENEIIQTATELLVDAINHNEFFNIPDITGKDIYISTPIEHYRREENGDLTLLDDSEYYLLYTDDEYLAGIVVCYENNEIISISFNTYISQIFNDKEISTEKFVLIANDGTLLLETSNNLSKKSTLNINHGEFFSQISKMSTISLISTLSIETRSSRVLDIPFVQQYRNTCWAAASLAYAWYYDPTENPSLTPRSVADLLNIGYNDGATFATVFGFLRDYFGLHCHFYSGSSLAKVTIINLINTNNPLIVGFSNTNAAHMVVLAGFDDGGSGSTMRYYLRDSNYSTYQIISTSTGILRMDYYSSYGTMTMDGALYLN